MFPRGPLPLKVTCTCSPSPLKDAISITAVKPRPRAPLTVGDVWCLRIASFATLVVLASVTTASPLVAIVRNN
eukprot:136067-Prorocentrum_minimum.AAC.2